MKKGKDCIIHDGATIHEHVILGDNVTIYPGAVVGRVPKSSGATQRVVNTDKIPPTIIGDYSIIGCNSVVYSDVQIGNNTLIGDTACVREGNRIGSFSVIAMGVTINYDTKIGNYVKIMDNSHITGNMLIEDHVFIGPLVATENDNSMGRTSMEIEEMHGPIIRRNATIGGGANLLPNTEIGENAIVAANAVVTRKVAPRTVVMGMPAKVVRKIKEHEIKND